VTIHDVQTSKGTREAAQQALREVHNKIQKLESEPWQRLIEAVPRALEISRCVMQRDSRISELLPSSKDYNQAIVRPLEFQYVSMHSKPLIWVSQGLEQFDFVSPHFASWPSTSGSTCGCCGTVPLGLPLGPRLSRKFCNVTWPPAKSSWNGRASAKRSDPRPTG
jgi:hypothetical protein